MSAPVDVLAVMARKPVKFRDPGMARAYESCATAFEAKGAAYMAEGNSAAVMFRRGFTGEHAGKWDAASRKTFAYAQFCAGRDCAAREARAAVAELAENARILLDYAQDGDTTGKARSIYEVKAALRAAIARVRGAA